MKYRHDFIYFISNSSGDSYDDCFAGAYRRFPLEIDFIRPRYYFSIALLVGRCRLLLRLMIASLEALASSFGALFSSTLLIVVTLESITEFLISNLFPHSAHRSYISMPLYFNIITSSIYYR